MFPVCVINICEDSFVITSREFGIDYYLQCVFQSLVHSFFLEKTTGSRSTGGVSQRTIPYTSNDKFSQEVIFHYLDGCLSGHAHVNQTYPDVVRIHVETVPWLPTFEGVIERVFFSAGKHDFQEKNYGQDSGKHIEGSNQYQISDL